LDSAAPGGRRCRPLDKGRPSHLDRRRLGRQRALPAPYRASPLSPLGGRRTAAGASPCSPPPFPGGAPPSHLDRPAAPSAPPFGSGPLTADIGRGWARGQPAPASGSRGFGAWTSWS
jgi:hypothetical protein